MITKQKTLFYFVGDTPFKDLVEAQKHDLKLLAMKPDGQSAVGADWDTECIETLVDWLMANAGPIVDILTTTPTSRLKARKSHGGTKKRKPKLAPAVVAPEVKPAKPAAAAGVVVTQSRAARPVSEPVAAVADDGE